MGAEHDAEPVHDVVEHVEDRRGVEREARERRRHEAAEAREELAGRVVEVDRVAERVDVRVLRERVRRRAGDRVEAREAADRRVVVARPQVVGLDRLVVPLPGVRVRVDRRSGRAGDVAERVVVVAVGDRPRAVDECTRRVLRVRQVVERRATPLEAEQPVAARRRSRLRRRRGRPPGAPARAGRSARRSLVSVSAGSNGAVAAEGANGSTRYVVAPAGPVFADSISERVVGVGGAAARRGRLREPSKRVVGVGRRRRTGLSSWSGCRSRRSRR